MIKINNETELKNKLLKGYIIKVIHKFNDDKDIHFYKLNRNTILIDVYLWHSIH